MRCQAVAALLLLLGIAAVSASRPAAPADATFPVMLDDESPGVSSGARRACCSTVEQLTRRMCDYDGRRALQAPAHASQLQRREVVGGGCNRPQNAGGCACRGSAALSLHDASPLRCLMCTGMKPDEVPSWFSRVVRLGRLRAVLPPAAGAGATCCDKQTDTPV
jgi:hypothetical protein